MHFRFSSRVIYWKGPAPFYFIEMPTSESELLKQASAGLTYGWGCIPATVTVGKLEWTTSLMPKDGLYLVPVRKAFREQLGLEAGQRVTLELEI